MRIFDGMQRAPLPMWQNIVGIHHTSFAKATQEGAEGSCTIIGEHNAVAAVRRLMGDLIRSTAVSSMLTADASSAEQA
jgi:hypothetical protein